MGRPKKLKVDAIRFRAWKDGTSAEFNARRDAIAFTHGYKRSVNIEELYWAARGWEVTIERYALPGDEGRDPDDYSGRRAKEVEFSIKGPDKAQLTKDAVARRRASFVKHCYELRDYTLRSQLAPDARALAEEVLQVEYRAHDHRIERQEEQQREKAKKAAEKAAVAAIPTLQKVFEDDVERRFRKEMIQKNTRTTYLYEATAFDLTVTLESGDVSFKDVQIHNLSGEVVEEWFGKYAARLTKFGKLPTSSSCENVLGHLAKTRKAIARDAKYREHAAGLAIVDQLLEELKAADRSSDGWRNRHRLTNGSAEKLLKAAQTDLERAAMALLFAGSRGPSEPCAVEFDHFRYDAKGNLWWHVCASVIEHEGKELELRTQTKTKAVDYRQLNVCKSLAQWIEARRGKSKFVLGNEDALMLPSDFVVMVEQLIARAGIAGTGISTYSLRHTVSDEVERLHGRTARDLVVHGKRDQTTGSLHYSHAEQERRWKELTFKGKPYGEHMTWARLDLS